MQKYIGLIAALIIGFAGQEAFAAGESSNNSCVNRTGQTFEQEFGPGSEELTRCIERRSNVKVLFQLNQKCKDDSCSKPYGLGNIANLLNDYEQTYGMESGKDFEVAVVVHSGGWPLVVQDDHQNGYGNWVTGTNPWQSTVENLMARGVKFYLCQNTVRSKVASKALPAGDVSAQLIPGVQYTTSGVAALADFQALGYTYQQP